MIGDFALPETVPARVPTRLSMFAGAVLGIAVALLFSVMPVNDAPRLQSAFGAATPEQGVLATDRVVDARRALQAARGPNLRGPDFDDTPVLFAAIAALALVAWAASLPRPSLVRAQQPGRWLSSARARAPPQA